MRVIRRIIYSIKQRFSKTCLLFLLVFILGNILCATLAITHSTKNIEKEFIDKYGVQITIFKQSYQSSFENKNQNLINDNIIFNYESMIRNNQVKYGDYSLIFDGLQSNEIHFKDEMSFDYIPFYFWGSQRSQFQFLENNLFKLIEGRSFTEEEIKNGNHVMILNHHFKYNNNEEIKLHDKITLKRNIYHPNQVTYKQEDIIFSEDVEYEVIGFYDFDENQMNRDNNYSIDNYLTHIIVPNQTIKNEEMIFANLNKKLGDSQNTNNTAILGDAYFQLKSPLALEMIQKGYPAIFDTDGIVRNEFKLYSTDELYRKISGPIKSLEEIAQYLFIVTYCFILLILITIIFIFMKERKYEIGILLTLGEKKINIILQMFLEILLVGLLSLNCSIISGKLLGNSLSKYIISASSNDVNILSSEEMAHQNELLEDYQVSYDSDYILSVNVYGLFIFTLASSLPVLITLQKKPKDILLKNDVH